MTIKDIQEHTKVMLLKHPTWIIDKMERFKYLQAEVNELETELEVMSSEKDIAYEMFDVVWNICALANHLSIDLTEYFKEKEIEITTRKVI